MKGRNNVIVGIYSAPNSASGDDYQKIPLLEFEADGSGVISVTNQRSFDQIFADSIEQGTGSNLDADTVERKEASDLGSDVANDGIILPANAGNGFHG